MLTYLFPCVSNDFFLEYNRFLLFLLSLSLFLSLIFALSTFGFVDLLRLRGIYCMSQQQFAATSAHYETDRRSNPLQSPVPRKPATKGDLMTKSGFSEAILSDISARRVVRSFIYQPLFVDLTFIQAAVIARNYAAAVNFEQTP